MESIVTEQSTMHTNNPSIKVCSLPEITSVIASHLSKKEIAVCALVCHTWSNTFSPLLWKVVKTRIPILKNVSFLQDLLAKNGRHIRSLTVADLPETYTEETDSSTNLAYDCPEIQHLVNLSIHTERERKNAMANIVKRNQHNLRCLELRFLMDNKTNKPPNWRGESWLGFCDMAPNLHSVSLDNWNMTRQDLLSLLKACPNLKFISLEDIFLDQGSSIRPSIKASAASAEDSLEELDTTSAYQLEIHDDFQHLGIKTLRMCSRLFHVLDLMPNIEVLEFYRFDRQVNETELEQFCQSIKDNCKKLDQILASGFECSMLSAVLESLTRLVTYIGCSDEQTVFRILDHAKTLEVANLSDGLERTFLPLNFLESCPRLKSLTTGNSSTTISEVQESFRRGWACTNLRELRLAIFKLQPALIEMIMRDLGAVREQPNHHQNNVQIWMSSQISQRQQIEAAIEALTPEQRQLSNELTGLIKEMRHLKRLNFGTGWYDIL